MLCTIIPNDPYPISKHLPSSTTMRKAMIMVMMCIAAIALTSCKEKANETPLPWVETEASEGSDMATPAESEVSGTSAKDARKAMESREAEAAKAAAKRAEGSAGLKNTYYSHRFTIGYPEALKERFSDETTFTAETIDKASRINVKYEQDGTFADLNECAQKFKQDGGEDEVFEKPKVSGNVMTMKSTKLGETCMYFVVKKDAMTGIVGKYYFRSSRAKDFEKYFPSIVKSVDIK